MKIYKVKYDIGTYSGEIDVACDDDDDNDVIKAKAKKLLKQKAGLFPAGLYYESYKIIEED